MNESFSVYQQLFRWFNDWLEIWILFLTVKRIFYDNWYLWQLIFMTFWEVLTFSTDCQMLALASCCHAPCMASTASTSNIFQTKKSLHKSCSIFKLLRHNSGQIKVILGVGDLENVPKVIVPSLFLSILRNIPRAIGLTWRFNSRFSSFDKSSFSEFFEWNWCFQSCAVLSVRYRTFGSPSYRQ